jgi:hypothetical protein
MERKFDEAANFVFVQSIEQAPYIYGKRYPDYARQDKIYLAWEIISHETKGSESRLGSSGTIKHLSLNCHRIKNAPNVFFS